MYFNPIWCLRFMTFTIWLSVWQLSPITKQTQWIYVVISPMNDLDVDSSPELSYFLEISWNLEISIFVLDSYPFGISPVTQSKQHSWNHELSISSLKVTVFSSYNPAGCRPHSFLIWLRSIFLNKEIMCSMEVISLSPIRDLISIAQFLMSSAWCIENQLMLWPILGLDWSNE